ncbi:Cytochrome d ubiquinol oxidase subunit 1 [Raoultella terrigena]|uniref:Cytochrome d ubiquinol oxidase subunit 1 n=1 Tax=Raoultella terrigena TaxID=577 RepID=A0A4U9DBS1_RAOTE|nr:Cytochrome d ubiquinol oxidase subunit 1 [Raoultella terrigena]
MDKQVTGLKELLVQHEARIRNGMKAYTLLEELRAGSKDQAVRDEFNSVKKDLGYGLLLKRYTPNVSDATEAQIALARRTRSLAWLRCTLPSVSWLPAAS